MSTVHILICLNKIHKIVYNDQDSCKIISWVSKNQKKILGACPPDPLWVARYARFGQSSYNPPKQKILDPPLF